MIDPRYPWNHAGVPLLLAAFVCVNPGLHARQADLPSLPAVQRTAVVSECRPEPATDYLTRVANALASFDDASLASGCPRVSSAASAGSAVQEGSAGIEPVR
jgi:hypothetical protein